MSEFCIPIKLHRVEWYDEGDIEFLGDTGEIDLHVTWSNGETQHYKFQGSWDGKSGPSECAGMIKAFVKVKS